MYPADLLFLGPLILYIFLGESVRSGEVNSGNAKGCASMQCGHGEHCVSRKFWCKNSPCPSMVYCSKTPRESLKGPMTCTSVRCTKGYICLVRVRGCRWDQECKQRIARCVSELEYQEGPAFCDNSNCPSGHRCILKESLCSDPPCRLIRSCAKSEDVEIWHNRCRVLGCPSEYECFLRRPSDNCTSSNSCKHTPDCTMITYNVQENRDCQGWVCPRNQECLARITESCNYENPGIENCKVNRTCVESLNTLDSATSSPSRRDISKISDDKLSKINSSYDSSDLNKKEKTCCNVNQSREIMEFEKWNPRNGSIYRVPVYVRYSVNRNRTGVGESLGIDEKPIGYSITEWLDYLRLKTGVDAINVWVKEAEGNEKYGQFNEWLTAVKTVLGSFRFEIWLREVRRLTSDNPAFQKWLAINSDVISLSNEHSSNDTEQKTITVIPEKKLDIQRVNESMDLHLTVRPENDSSVSSSDQQMPNTRFMEDRKHPRENLGPPDSKKENITNLNHTIGNSLNKGNNSVSNNSKTFENIKKPQRVSEPEKSSVSIQVKKFTEHEDQKESLKNLKSPESMERQYFQRVYELNTTNVPGDPTKSQDLSSQNETKIDRNLTKTYTLVTPVEDDLRVISPWETVQVLDPEKRTYYTLVRFPQKQTSNRIRIIGYPLVVSDIVSENGRDEKRTNHAQDPWTQIFNYPENPHQIVPLIEQNAEYLPKRKGGDLKSGETLLGSKNDHPVPKPNEYWYSWNGKTPNYLSRINHIDEKNTNGYHHTMSSQQYLDAYVDAVIKDVLSKVILNWTNSENLNSLSQDFKRIEKKYVVDQIQGGHLPVKNTTKNSKQQNGRRNISLKEVAAEDHQYDYKDHNEDEPQAMETSKKISRTYDTVYSSDSPSYDDEEYYSDDISQQEYSDEPFRHQDEYFEDLETNSADYNFEYYADEEDEVFPKESDDVAKLSDS